MIRVLVFLAMLLAFVLIRVVFSPGGAEQTTGSRHWGIPGKLTLSFGEPWESEPENLRTGPITLTVGTPTGGSGVGAEYSVTAGDPNDVGADDRPGVTKWGRR